MKQESIIKGSWMVRLPQLWFKALAMGCFDIKGMKKELPLPIPTITILCDTLVKMDLLKKEKKLSKTFYHVRRKWRVKK